MARMEEVELTNMCMVCDGKGNVLVQNKKGDRTWHGWNFPGGHVEQGEFVTPSVIREVREETGLTIENPKLCGIKEFQKEQDGKRFIVFLYVASRFSGELRSSDEGDVVIPDDIFSGSKADSGGYGDESETYDTNGAPLTQN